MTTSTSKVGRKLQSYVSIRQRASESDDSVVLICPHYIHSSHCRQNNSPLPKGNNLNCPIDSQQKSSISLSGSSVPSLGLETLWIKMTHLPVPSHSGGTGEHIAQTLIQKGEGWEIYNSHGVVAILKWNWAGFWGAPTLGMFINYAQILLPGRGLQSLFSMPIGSALLEFLPFLVTSLAVTEVGTGE